MVAAVVVAGAEYVVGALFIEVGPISVVLNGVSLLFAGGDSIGAPGFPAPGPTTGEPKFAFRSAAGGTGIEKLGL